MTRTGHILHQPASKASIARRFRPVSAILGGLMFGAAAHAAEPAPADAQIGSPALQIPIGRPNPRVFAIKRSVLGDPVVVKDWQIEQVRRRGDAGKRAFVPFTEAEVRKDAKPGTLSEGRGSTVVNTPRGPMAISAYVAQINAFEAWLSDHGASLRDPGTTGSDGVTRLPLRFRLRPFGSKGPGDVTIDQATVDHHLIIDPGYPIDSVMQPADALRVRSTGILAQWADAHAAGPAMPTFGSTPAPLKTMSGGVPPICPKACTLHYGSGGLVLSQIGQRIVGDDRYDEVCYYTLDSGGGRVPQTGCLDSGTAQNLGSIAKKTVKTIRWRDVYRAAYGTAAVDALIKSFQDPCAIAALDQKLIDAFYLGAKTSSVGDKSALGGTRAAAFWDGILRLGWENANDCIGNTSGNGWFSGYACLAYSAHANYTKSMGLDVADKAGVDASITLFGQDFPIVSGDQTITWKQPATGDFVSPTIKSTIENYDKSEHYATPPFIIPIGPVPLSVTAGLDVGFTLGALPPQQNFLQAFAKHQAPKMSMSSPLGAQAKMSLFMDADIDVIVAKAGIEGRLNAFDGQVDGSIASSIDAPANIATLTKSYGFKGSAFSGSISAFVEVWYVLGSKRWSIEIVDFDGVSGGGTVASSDFSGSAVIPEQAKPDCDG